MIEEIEIRESLQSDFASIEKLYPEAFPEEELLPLVRELIGEATTVLSLVVMVDLSVMGHVIFTTCSIAGTTDKVVLLGPSRSLQLGKGRAWAALSFATDYNG